MKYAGDALLHGCVLSRRQVALAHHALTYMRRNFAAAGLYSAALAIPIRQTEDVHRLVVECQRCLRAFVPIVMERLDRSARKSCQFARCPRSGSLPPGRLPTGSKIRGLLVLYMPHEAAGADNSPHDYVDRYAYLDCSY